MNPLPLAALSGCLLLPLPPDVLTPGYRPVAHELVVDASPLFDQFEFVAFPVRGFGGTTHIVPGQPFRFSSKYGTRIFALEKGASFAEDKFDAQIKTLATGDIPVGETNQVPVVSPTESITSRLRIRSVENGVIALEVVGETTERNTPLVVVVVGVMVLGAGGLIALAMKRRRKSSAEDAT